MEYHKSLVNSSFDDILDECTHYVYYGSLNYTVLVFLGLINLIQKVCICSTRH